MTSDPNELLNKVEDLCQELQEYYEEMKGGWPCVRHPLLFNVPHFPQMNALLNYQLAYLKGRVEDLKKEKKFDQFIWMHQRPYRFEALQAIEDQIPRREFWPLFGSLWTDSENLWQQRLYLDAVLRTRDPLSRMMMRIQDRRRLAELPETLSVCRGHQRYNKEGFSWTLDIDRAKWFATRYGQKGSVTYGQVHKGNVVALLGNRGEDEVVCLPENVVNRRTKKV